MAPGSPLSQGVPANTLLIRHLKSRCKAEHISGEFVQIDLPPSSTICEETTREDIV